jgi:hypothetical protein
MPDENRVFDVSKPNRVSPSATSRPVIVGHHPMNDPMVREDGGSSTGSHPSPTKIPITDTTSEATPLTVEQAMTAHQAEAAPVLEEQPVQGSPAIFSDHGDEGLQPPAPESPSEPAAPAESVGQGPFTAMDPGTPPPEAPSELPPPAPHQEPDIEGLHFNEPKPKRGRGKIISIIILVLLVAGYLAIDSGLVNAGIKMPFHIFKQKSETAATTAPPAANKPAATGPTIPDGFKEYKLTGTNISFAAPLTWGDPASTTDPGYSKRGGDNQTDGTYAYLVNFATNKDIQIAVTSSKFLPASRAALYYDYLQWCTGSADNKIYQSVLNFSTASKVDTPTTITCNQGPLAGASAIDSSTIVQLKAADAAGKVVGDIYTVNLKDPSLVVFRVKDAAMANSTDIKQLLNTVQITSTPSTSAAGQ